MSGSAIASDDVATVGCPEIATSQPFAPWGDSGDYFLAPGADMEDGASDWTLTGGAATVEGSEPFDLVGADGRMSLGLPARGTATSPAMCIGVEHRSMRFALRGSGPSMLRVEAVYDTRSGRSKRVHLASIVTDGEWSMSDSVPMVVNEYAGETNALPVSLRFSAEGAGTVQIDDVYIDPYRMR